MSSSSTNLFLIALASSTALTALFVPVWREWSLRAGLVDAPGHRKIHDQPVALAGGLAIFSGMATALFCGWMAHKLGWLEEETYGRFTGNLQTRPREWFALLGGALGMTSLGLIDDKFDQRPSVKFAGQLVIAALVTAVGVRVPAFVPGNAANFVFTVLWILTVTNAVNFTDNMNGLCTGLAVIGALGLGIWSATHSQFAVAAVGYVLAGAALGVLPFNFPRASVFLGDSGSHLLGFTLSVLTLLSCTDAAGHSTAVSALFPVLLLFVPLADLVTVVLHRVRHGKPFYIGDNNHFSHRLVRAGLRPAQAVVLLWIVAAAVASIAFVF